MLFRSQNAFDFVIADAKEKASCAAAPSNRSIEDLTRGLQTWCEANRAELLDGHSKTVVFGNGTVAWRARPASITLRNVEKIIQWLKSRPLLGFLRMKAEINKEAMLSEPAEARRVPGVTIASGGEDFIVEPIAVPLQEVA